MKHPKSFLEGIGLFLFCYVPASYLLMFGFMLFGWLMEDPKYSVSAWDLIKPVVLAPLAVLLLAAGLGPDVWFYLLPVWLLCFIALMIFLRRRSNAPRVA